MSRCSTPGSRGSSTAAADRRSGTARRSAAVHAHEELSHAGGLLRALDLDRELELDVEPAGDVAHLEEFAAASKLRTDREWCREADLIEAVVHPHDRVGHAHELRGDRGEQREREKAMSNRAAER